jgi:DNA-directed RNA polymerase subunit alpha
MTTWKKVTGNGDWLLFVDKVENSPQFGRFCIQPLQEGTASIVGKSLVTSFTENLSGAAVSALNLRFYREPGVNASRESVVLKQLTDSLEKLRLVSAGCFPLTGKTKKRGPCFVLSSDVTFNAPVRIVSSTPSLALLEPGETLELHFLVQWGKGKMTAEQAVEPKLPQGWKSLSRNHSPVRDVRFDVALIDVGGSSGNEQLIVEVTTDGSLSPEDAIRRAGQLVRFPHQPLAG